MTDTHDIVDLPPQDAPGLVPLDAKTDGKLLVDPDTGEQVDDEVVAYVQTDEDA